MASRLAGASDRCPATRAGEAAAAAANAASTTRRKESRIGDRKAILPHAYRSALMMKRAALAVVVLAAVVVTQPTLAQRPATSTTLRAAAQTYFPDRFDWQHKK